MRGVDHKHRKGRRRNDRDGRRTGHRSAGRRTPPPARTGQEAKFFADALRSGVELVVLLADGRKVRGPVEDVDRDQVTIAEATGPIVIRKAEIRYLYEDS